LAFLGAQALWVTFGSPREYLPPKPDFAQFALELGGWHAEGEAPLAPAVLDVLNADAMLTRVYAEQGTPWTAQLLVAWFQTQRGGRHQPHSPKVCLPAAGWISVKSDTLRAGDLEVNRYIAVHQKRSVVVLYWYQTPFRSETSEWAAKFWVMADSLRHNRTDTALVRVVVPATDNDEAASAAGLRFVRAARAELARRIPQ
jgi:EpsI family protein